MNRFMRIDYSLLNVYVNVWRAREPRSQVKIKVRDRSRTKETMRWS